MLFNLSGIYKTETNFVSVSFEIVGLVTTNAGLTSFPLKFVDFSQELAPASSVGVSIYFHEIKSCKYTFHSKDVSYLCLLSYVSSYDSYICKMFLILLTIKIKRSCININSEPKIVPTNLKTSRILWAVKLGDPGGRTVHIPIYRTDNIF